MLRTAKNLKNTFIFCNVLFSLYSMDAEKKISILNKALSYMVEKSYAESIPFLVKKGANINAFFVFPNCSFPATPVTYAAACGHEKSLKVLLKCKADPNLISHVSRSALIEAASLGKKRCIELLIKHKANMFYFTPKIRVSALCESINKKHFNCGKYLLQYALKLDDICTEIKSQFSILQMLSYFEYLPSCRFKELFYKTIELFLIIKKKTHCAISLLPKPVILMMLFKTIPLEYHIKTLMEPLYENNKKRFDMHIDIKGKLIY